MSHMSDLSPRKSGKRCKSGQTRAKWGKSGIPPKPGQNGHIGTKWGKSDTAGGRVRFVRFAGGANQKLAYPVRAPDSLF